MDARCENNGGIAQQRMLPSDESAVRVQLGMPEDIIIISQCMAVQ